METVLLARSDVSEHARMAELIPAIEAAFGAYERGEAFMPAKSYIELDRYNGDFRSMPAYVDTGEWDAAGVKWVNVHPDNVDEHGLPTVMGLMVYSDPETALPLAVMDGTELTRLRTGAAAAVATEYLSVPDASSLGLVGAGAQSVTQVEAIATVRPIERIVASDQDEAALSRFEERVGDRFDVQRGSISQAAACDILCTVTPVRDPIVPADAVGSQTHINAIGADAPGKQELDPEILSTATVVIDDYDQCTHSGEINVPWADGTLTHADIHGTLGEVICGDKPGRGTSTGVTVFDSTGLAIQDVAAARAIYERATAEAAGSAFDFLQLE